MRAASSPRPPAVLGRMGEGRGVRNGERFTIISHCTPLPDPLPEREGDESSISHPSSLTSHPASLVTLEFAVRDTGIGIPRFGLGKHLPAVYPSRCLHGTPFGGTGLGLSISLKPSAMMGGRIGSKRTGTRKHLRFHRSNASGARTPCRRRILRRCSAFPTTALRTLLVEDNPANQKIAAYIFKEAGHTIEVARDGQRSAWPSENRYDVILMDVQMPRMDGLETTAAIRAREGDGPRVPIIAMTAHAMKGDHERCLAAGMDATFEAHRRPGNDRLDRGHGGRGHVAAGVRGRLKPGDGKGLRKSRRRRQAPSSIRNWPWRSAR